MSTFFQAQQQVAALDPRLGNLMASAGLYNLRALIKGCLLYTSPSPRDRG